MDKVCEVFVGIAVVEAGAVVGKAYRSPNTDHLIIGEHSFCEMFRPKLKSIASIVDLPIVMDTILDDAGIPCGYTTVLRDQCSRIHVYWGDDVSNFCRGRTLRSIISVRKLPQKVFDCVYPAIVSSELSTMIHVGTYED